MAHLKYDLTNQVFGKLTALRHLGGGRWLCRCECGVEKSIAGGALRAPESQKTTSCGCSQPTRQTGAGHPRHQGDRIAYSTAHKRVASRRGRARDHACLVCEQPAASWAYRGNSPRELREWRDVSPVKSGWLRYSPDPADYDPLCWRCHARKDILEARARA